MADMCQLIVCEEHKNMLATQAWNVKSIHEPLAHVFKCHSRQPRDFGGVRRHACKGCFHVSVRRDLKTRVFGKKRGHKLSIKGSGKAARMPDDAHVCRPSTDLLRLTDDTPKHETVENMAQRLAMDFAQ